MMLVPAAFVLVAFLAVIAGWGPEFFGGLGLVGALSAFRRRRRSWWGLAAASGGVVAGTGILVGWPSRAVLAAAVAVFAVVAVVRALGHLPSAGRSLDAYRDTSPSRR